MKKTDNSHTSQIKKYKNQIMVVELESISVPTFKEVRGKDWVNFGERNDYPDTLIELYNTSAIHATCIDSKVDAVVGEGIQTIGNTIINSNNETLDEVFSKCALDYVLYNGYSLNVIWNRGGDRIAEFYHIPFNNVRSGKLNEEDVIEEYFYSSNWANTRKFKPVRYASFSSTDNKGDNSSQIFYHFDYTPGNMIYPLPSYQGAVNDINLDARISTYHNTNISNNISAGMIITFPNGIPEEDEKRALYNGMVEAFSGEKNAGKLFLNFSDGIENAPKIEALPSVNDDYYTTLENRITSRVLTSHKISSPLLLGIRTDGANGLGSNSDEIKVAYTHFLSSVIQPIQRSMSKSFEKVLRSYGMNVQVQIVPNKMDFGQSINETNQQPI